MNMNRIFKKVAAVGVSTVMAGLAFSGTAYADLGDLPAPIVEGSSVSGAIVVGSDLDNAAANTLQDYFSVDNAGSLSDLNGVSKDVELGDTLIAEEYSAELDDDDITVLADSTFDFDSDTVDYREIIKLGTNSPIVATSLSSSDDDYEDNVYVELQKGDLGYYFVTDEADNLSRASTTEPLEIKFLGKVIKITNIVDENSITAQVGEEVFLDIDESVTLFGKTITLLNVASTSVVVDVDGVQETVGTTSETVNGIDIKLDEAFAADLKADRSATLLIGEDDVTKTYDDGDAYIGEDEDDPDWVWDLGELTNTTVKGNTNDGTDGPTIGIINDFVAEDFSDGPITVGEQYVLPNNFAALSFDGLKVSDYVTITFDIDTSVDISDIGAFGDTSADALAIVSTGTDAIGLDQDANGWLATASTFTADEKSDKVYLINGTSTTTPQRLMVFYEDSDNNLQHAGNLSINNSALNFGYIDYKDTDTASDIELGYQGRLNASSWNLTVQQENSDLGVSTDLFMNWRYASNVFAQLGATADTEEAGELQYGNTNIGTKDEDHMTHYGIKIQDPKSKGASDKVIIEVPGDLQLAEITVGTGDAASSVEAAIISPGAAGSYDNLVLVGGPCVNSLTAEWMGLSYPSCGSASTIPTDQALVKMMEQGGQTALIVAGWERADTQRAASQVSAGSLTGDEKLV